MFRNILARDLGSAPFSLASGLAKKKKKKKFSRYKEFGGSLHP